MHQDSDASVGPRFGLPGQRLDTFYSCLDVRKSRFQCPSGTLPLAIGGEHQKRSF